MTEKIKMPVIRFKGFTDAWEQRKVQNIAELTYGGGTPSTIDNELWEGSIPWIQSSDLIEHNVLSVSVKKHISDKAIRQSATQLIPQDSIAIITRVGVGKVAYMPFSYATSQDFVSLSKLNISGLFAVYSLYLRLQKDMNIVQGTSIKGITKDELLDKPLSVPTTECEQIKIGCIFKQLDNLITLHQRKYDKLVNVKKSLLEKMFPSYDERVPKIHFKGFTDAWEQHKFGECFIEHREKSISENEEELLTCAIDGIFLNSEYFSHQRGQSNIGYIKVKYGDLILSAQNLHLGNANVNLKYENGIISPAYKAFSLNLLEPLFIQAWVKQDKTKNYFLSATTEGASVCRKNVVWEWLNDKEFYSPNINEQIVIGNLFKQLDNLITLHQRKLEKLKNIKKSLLDKMFV